MVPDGKMIAYIANFDDASYAYTQTRRPASRRR